MESISVISDQFKSVSPLLLGVETFMRESIRNTDGRRAARKAQLGVEAKEHLLVLTTLWLLGQHLPQICTSLQCEPSDTFDELCAAIMSDAGLNVSENRRRKVVDRIVAWSETLQNEAENTVDSIERMAEVTHYIAPDLCPFFGAIGLERRIELSIRNASFMTFVHSFVLDFAGPAIEPLSWPEIPASPNTETMPG
jgi:hypothetical protein